MNSITQLTSRFKELGITNFSFFPGSNPNATPEQIAKAINDALDRLEMGDFEEI